MSDALSPIPASAAPAGPSGLRADSPDPNATGGGSAGASAGGFADELARAAAPAPQDPAPQSASPGPDPSSQEAPGPAPAPAPAPANAAAGETADAAAPVAPASGATVTTPAQAAPSGVQVAPTQGGSPTPAPAPANIRRASAATLASRIDAARSVSTSAADRARPAAEGRATLRTTGGASSTRDAADGKDDATAIAGNASAMIPDPGTAPLSNTEGKPAVDPAGATRGDATRADTVAGAQPAPSAPSAAPPAPAAAAVIAPILVPTGAATSLRATDALAGPDSIRTGSGAAGSPANPAADATGTRSSQTLAARIEAGQVPAPSTDAAPAVVQAIDALPRTLLAAAQAAFPAARGPAPAGALTGADPAPGLQSLASLQAQTAPPAVVDVRTPVGHAGFAQDLSSQIVLLARGSSQSAQLSLHPAELGPVSISIQMNGQQATISLQAAHEATREPLRQSLPQLGTMFQANGLQLAQAQVGDGSSGHPSWHDGPAQRPGAPAIPGFPGAVAVAPPSGTRAVSVRLVDTWA